MNKQEIAEEKAFKVVNSCKTPEQLIYAKRYIYLYYAKYNDEVSFLNLIEDYIAHPQNIEEYGRNI